jgi:hypothetical protein
VPHAERIVDEECAEFSDWMREAAARDAIRPLYAALEAVCRREVAFAMRETPAALVRRAAAPEGELAARTARRVAAKLLAGPMAELRGAAARGERVDDVAAALARLFGVQMPAAAAEPVAGPPADVLPGLRADLRPELRPSTPRGADRDRARPRPPRRPAARPAGPAPLLVRALRREPVARPPVGSCARRAATSPSTTRCARGTRSWR